MAQKVEFRIKNLKAPDGTKATRAEIAGSIDATSIVQFQNVMDKLVEKGVQNLILDCASVKYINSTGLGTLLKYVDTFEGNDGHIAFTRVPSKVMLVMEMLGFNALFTIVPDDATALHLFGGKPLAAAPPAAPAVQPAVMPARPPAVPTISKATGQAAAARPTTRLAPDRLPGVSPAMPPTPGAPAVAPAAAPAGYPITVECMRCRVALDVEAAGKYRCPRCASILVAEPAGRVRFFTPKKPRPVRVSLPARPELVEGLGKLVEGVARQAGFNGEMAGDIGKAVVAASRGVAETAYADDANGLIHLLMVPDAGALTVRISDFGKRIPAEAGAPKSPQFDRARDVMDSVELKPNPKGGNLITLSKSAGPATA